MGINVDKNIYRVLIKYTKVKKFPVLLSWIFSLQTTSLCPHVAGLLPWQIVLSAISSSSAFWLETFAQTFLFLGDLGTIVSWLPASITSLGWAIVEYILISRSYRLFFLIASYIYTCIKILLFRLQSYWLLHQVNKKNKVIGTNPLCASPVLGSLHLLPCLILTTDNYFIPYLHMRTWRLSSLSQK